MNLSVLMRMWWHPSEITQAGPKASCVIGRSLQNFSNIIVGSHGHRPGGVLISFKHCCGNQQLPEFLDDIAFQIMTDNFYKGSLSRKGHLFQVIPSHTILGDARIFSFILASPRMVQDGMSLKGKGKCYD